MQNLIIPYSRKGNKKELIIGVFYIVVAGGYALFRLEDILSYIFFLTGFLYLASVNYKKKYPYLKVENGILKKLDLIPKQINLCEIIRIKEFAGDYTLFTSSKKLKIHYVLIDESAKKNFKVFIDSLHPQIEHTTKQVSEFNSH